MSGTTETHRKLVNMVARGKLEQSDDVPGVQRHQVSLLADETKGNVERIQQYGFTSNPMPGSECVVLFPNGNRDHGVIISIENRASRLRGMAPGEVSLYTDEGDYISLRRGNGTEIVTHTFYVKADTQVIIEAGKVTVRSAGDVEITAPNIKLHGNVAIDGGTLTHNGVNVGSTHVHHAGPSNSDTGPPK